MPHTILIYGAPGTGKYTIGKILAQKLSYDFIHNHMLVNPVMDIFKAGSPSYVSVASQFRNMVTKQLVLDKRNIVTTYAFGVELGVGYNDNTKALKNITQLVEKGGGAIDLVHLTCDLEENKKRLASVRRKEHGKLTNKDKLENIIKTTDANKKVDFTDHLSIDVSAFSANRVAEELFQRYKRPK